MSLISDRCLFAQMHFLLYGTGMQTWEYSPLYAIRSYAYLWLHALPACLHAHVLQTNKVTLWTSSCVLCCFIYLNIWIFFHIWWSALFLTICRGFSLLFFLIAVLQVLVFYFVRCILAFSCCVCELYFYKWVSKTPHCDSHAGATGRAKLVALTAPVCVSDNRAVCKKFGLHVGRLMLAFLVLSTGMFCSSAGWSHSHTCFIHTHLCCCS